METLKKVKATDVYQIAKVSYDALFSALKRLLPPEEMIFAESKKGYDQIFWYIPKEDGSTTLKPTSHYRHKSKKQWHNIVSVLARSCRHNPISRSWSILFSLPLEMTSTISVSPIRVICS